jgi:hypothetical protein
MNTRDLMIRCLAVREKDQWVGICLPFDLAAQADSFPEMRAKLEDQIRHYVEDALVGPDRANAGQLLSRRAPVKYWAKYYWIAALEHIRTKAENFRRFKTPVPLKPAAC